MANQRESSKNQKHEELNLSQVNPIQPNINPTSPSAQGTQGQSKDKTIGQYILGKSIGEGTFGKVKLGTHIITNEKVAVKILEKNKIIDVADVERVSREIHILKIVRHPNVVQLYEIIETQRKLYLIMEFASGGELFDYIVQHQRVKEKEACKFFQQIIAGVEYISRLNVVHRDLKPENLLLDYDKGIKLVDFGLSNTYKNGELLKTACGSPCYAAPEMIAGKKYHGTNVDIWSCGVILFALVCGYLPFEDPNTSNLYKKILSADFSVPRFVSNEAKDLISCILNTDPEKRYKIEDIRKHPWFNLVKCDEHFRGTIVGIDPVPIDPVILESLAEYNINVDYARKCLEANKHNHITATYFLLLKKHLKNGGESIADPRSPKYDPTYFMKRQPNFKNLVDAKQDQKQEQVRGGSQQPTRIRRIADGLADMERYTTVQRQKALFGDQNRQGKRRAESSGGYSTIQEPNEVITSNNIRDLTANHERSPSISPSTIRVSNNTHHHLYEKQNSRGGLSNSMFYHNMMMPDSVTPISSNMQTSTTPGLEFQMQNYQRFQTMDQEVNITNQRYQTIDLNRNNQSQTRRNRSSSKNDPYSKPPLSNQMQTLQNQYNMILSGNQNMNTSNRHPTINIDSSFYHPFNIIKQSNNQPSNNTRKRKTANYSVNYSTNNDKSYLLNTNGLANYNHELMKLQNTALINQSMLSNTSTPFEIQNAVISNRDKAQKRDDFQTYQPMQNDMGISYLSKSSLKNQNTSNLQYLMNATPTQLIAQAISPSMFPREPKMNQQKQLISSAVRSRRYKKENSSTSKHESPKALYTRNLLNVYKGTAQRKPNNSNIQGNQNNNHMVQVMSGESITASMDQRQINKSSLNPNGLIDQSNLYLNPAQAAYILNNYTPQSQIKNNSMINYNKTQQLDFVTKLQEQQQQQQQIASNLSAVSTQQRSSSQKKGMYTTNDNTTPSSNMNVIEKNPMNITIYNKDFQIYWNGQQMFQTPKDPSIIDPSIQNIYSNGGKGFSQKIQ